MGRLKRFCCIAFSSFLIISSPVQSYAVVTAVTAACYVITCLLAACGAYFAADAVSDLVGDWTTKEDYLRLGAAGELGIYAQMVYIKARDTSAEVAEKYSAVEDALISCVSAKWGDVITGISPLVADLKVFLRNAYGLSYDGVLQVPVVPDSQVWGVTEWSTREPYPVLTGPLYPSFPTDDDYQYFLTCYVESGYGTSCMGVQNWYYVKALDVFGVYNAATRILTTYKRGDGGTYAEYAAACYNNYVNADGTLKYQPGIQSGWYRSTMLCSAADAGSLPFPVFGSLAAAERYVATGVVADTYVSGTVPLQAESYRDDVAGLGADVISDTFTVPASPDLAAENLGALADVYPAGTVDDILGAVGDAGIDVVPALDLSDVLSGIKALPGAIADAIVDAFTLEASEVGEQLSIPGVAAEKFPFCIPFDFVYLIQSLAAERETPRFVIPIDIDYAFVSYHEEFVVDFADWGAAVAVFRIMLDLLFCSILISATRPLIRG